MIEKYEKEYNELKEGEHSNWKNQFLKKYKEAQIALKQKKTNDLSNKKGEKCILIRKAFDNKIKNLFKKHNTNMKKMAEEIQRKKNKINEAFEKATNKLAIDKVKTLKNEKKTCMSDDIDTSSIMKKIESMVKRCDTHFNSQLTSITRTRTTNNNMEYFTSCVNKHISKIQFMYGKNDAGKATELVDNIQFTRFKAHYNNCMKLYLPNKIPRGAFCYGDNQTLKKYNTIIAKFDNSKDYFGDYRCSQPSSEIAGALAKISATFETNKKNCDKKLYMGSKWGWKFEEKTSEVFKVNKQKKATLKKIDALKKKALRRAHLKHCFNNIKKYKMIFNIKTCLLKRGHQKQLALIRPDTKYNPKEFAPALSTLQRYKKIALIKLELYSRKQQKAIDSINENGLNTKPYNKAQKNFYAEFEKNNKSKYDKNLKYWELKNLKKRITDERNKEVNGNNTEITKLKSEMEKQIAALVKEMNDDTKKAHAALDKSTDKARKDLLKEHKEEIAKFKKDSKNALQ